jgi:thiol-disulfide isomerase/thioredoxin
VFFMTVSYAIGACVPLLALALASKKATGTLRALKAHAQAVRQVSGLLIVGSAIALWAGLFAPLQTAVPGYTNSLQNHLEGSASIASKLKGLQAKGEGRFGSEAPAVGASLMDYGLAPPFTGISAWLNTPGNKPLTLQSLRGKVVLVDFWTYSCINCRRSLPHVEAWYRDYAKYGLVVVGVHTPEFAFEHVVSNVSSAAKGLGVRYPIAIDNNYGTWDAYGNQYWPAEYLIDQQGVIRREEFGEGNYAGTETAIRALLEAGGATDLPAPTDVPNLTPTSIGSPETYVGYERLQDESFVANPSLQVEKATSYELPAQLPALTLGFGGTWTVNSQEATSGPGAELELGYDAADVYLVLGGTGTVQVSVNGHETMTVHVSGIPGLYTMVGTDSEQSGLLKLAFSPGLQAYDFTFG